MVKASMTLLMSLAFAAAGAAPALAQPMQQGQQGQPGQQMQQGQQSQSEQVTRGPGSITETMSATATIMAIDKDARTVTLQTVDGSRLKLDAPEDADLNKLKIGDKVDVQYQEALAVDVKPPGTPMAGPTEETSRQRRMGGVTRTHEVTAIAEVVSTNPSRNQVTFRGPKGNVETITVKDPQMQEKARKLKPGDKVQFRYTEATALSIRPRPQQPE